MIVQYGKIINGTNDVAKYLGINPEKALFLHSTSFDENDVDNLKRVAINKGRMIYSEILSYSSNVDNGSKSAISYFNDELLDKMEEMDVIKRDNIIKVTDEKNVDYPYNSVSTMLNQKVKKDEELRKKLDGFTIVSSYISKEDEETARLINGHLLMDRKLQEKFNSKYEFRKMAEKYNFSIPDGIEIKGLINLQDGLNKLKAHNSESVSIWIKLETQSSGTGNIKIDDYVNVDEKEIENKIKEIAKKVYDEEYIMKDMQFIIEYDVSSVNKEKEVANIGVEAVITENKVTILGGVEQATDNGKFVGSKITDNTYKYLDIAQKTAKEAFIAVSEEGYRGFMTIDVLVTKNEDTSEIKAYNIDPNARFSAGTMLLRNVQASEEYNKKRMYGISFANAIPKTENMIDSIVQWLGEDLYNKKGDYTGIIPALINDINQIGEDRYYFKSVVVSDSYENAEKEFIEFKNKIKKFLSDKVI